MTHLKIISATPGLTTQEEILKIIQERTTGITTKQLSKILNRPVSMLQICLKRLITSKQIYSKKSRTSHSIIYYPIMKKS
ncbi:MAG: winged helix-turn-helix domain-containing protein [Xenococcus sp. (in: cyanobacteria)]